MKSKGFFTNTGQKSNTDHKGCSGDNVDRSAKHPEVTDAKQKIVDYLYNKLTTVLREPTVH